MWPGMEYIIRGKVVTSPQVQAVVSLVSPNLHVARPSTKVLQLRTNQLVIWFVQVRVND
jgi:hypothetical protein